MKAGLPLYEGDSLFHYAPGEPAVEAPAKRAVVKKVADVVALKPAVVPQIETPKAGDEATLDLAGIELRARLLRAEYVQKLVRGFFARVGSALKKLQQSETEAYLSQSKSLEELEDRLRQLERDGRLLQI